MRLQMSLLIAVTEQLPGVCHAEKPTQASPVCGGEADSPWSPELLLYSSPKELQTLATLKLQVAMLDQQIHLEKVLPGQEVVVYLGSWEPVSVTLLRLALIPTPTPRVSLKRKST